MQLLSRNKVFLLLTILCLCFTFSSNAKETYHSPNISLGMKLGNTRDIGRLGILVPLFDSQDKMTYFHAFGMMDSKSNK